jgi:hypothetical protein
MDEILSLEYIPWEIVAYLRNTWTLTVHRGVHRGQIFILDT